MGSSTDVHGAIATIQKGGTIEEDKAASDQELARRTGNVVSRIFFPESDPDALIDRVRKVLAVPDPLRNKPQRIVPPSITVPLIQTVQRADAMPLAERTQLIWALYEGTDFTNQSPGSRIYYGARMLPDGQIEVQVIDQVAFAQERDRAASAAPASTPVPPPRFWTYVTTSPFWLRWYPVYRALCMLYAFWLALFVLPRPLPTQEGGIAVAIEVGSRILLLLGAIFFAPVVFLVRFFQKYRLVFRSTLEKDPLIGITK